MIAPDRRPWIQFGFTTIFVFMTYAALFQFAFARVLQQKPEAAFWTLVLGVPHTLLIAWLIWMAWRHNPSVRASDARRLEAERPREEA